MADRLTDEEIARLRALEREATPGPWRQPNPEACAIDGPGRLFIEVLPESVQSARDAALIVALRNDTTALLDEVEARRRAARPGWQTSVRLSDGMLLPVELHDTDDVEAWTSKGATVLGTPPDGWTTSRHVGLRYTTEVHAPAAGPSPLPAVVDKAIEARELASTLVGLLIEAADEMKGPSCDRTVQHLSERIGVAVARANTLGIGPTHAGEGDIGAGELVHRLAVALDGVNRILWMAKEYADAGGSGGPELRDYEEATADVAATLAEARKAGAIP